MRTVRVDLDSRSYDILIGNNLLSRLGELLQGLGLGRQALLVTDTNVGPIYGAKVTEILTQAGFKVAMVQVPAGEGAKTLAQAAGLYDAAFDHELDRNCSVVALGGGVVGDLAGFVAATYMRGVPLVQVPTTLLAQVDSSVGGKVAVNHPRGKNIIGAFYQPKLVVIDTSTLTTLDRRNVRAGLGEVIKYGVIWNDNFFTWLKEKVVKLLDQDVDALGQVIETCCQIKAAVVSQDETEQGRRAILNYGHTVGHAIELLSGYGTYLHGEAVAIGMVCEARLARQIGLLDAAVVNQIADLITSMQLPGCLPEGIDRGAMIKSMYTDKKVTAGQLTFALPERIGEAKVVKGVSEQDIMRVLEDIPC